MSFAELPRTAGVCAELCVLVLGKLGRHCWPMSVEDVRVFGTDGTPTRYPDVESLTVKDGGVLDTRHSDRSVTLLSPAGYVRVEYRETSTVTLF